MIVVVLAAALTTLVVGFLGGLYVAAGWIGDDIGRAIWREVHRGHITEEEAEAIVNLICRWRA